MTTLVLDERDPIAPDTVSERQADDTVACLMQPSSGPARRD